MAEVTGVSGMVVESMQVADFDFELPESLIAQDPSPERGGSRLLVLDRRSGALTHTTFTALGDFLRDDDLLVVNSTSVIPARLLGQRVPSGGAVECLLLEELPRPGFHGSPVPSSPDPPFPLSPGPPVPQSPGSFWMALVHPGQKLKSGSRVRFERDGLGLNGEVLARHFHGRRTVRLWTDDGSDPQTVIDRIGHIPLPPYIARDDTLEDRDRYQTVYARERGSIAAPTAGLHFTQPLLDTLARRGIERAEVTLHVGYGTFQPVRVDRVEDHAVDPERFSVSPDTASALTRARRGGRRIVAVGTTTVRTLESLEITGVDTVEPGAGSTGLFIHPGHTFRLVDAMVTNFHLPRSSLLMLACAFGGRDHVLAAYRDAVARGYRFYSYGDAMLIS